MQTPALSTLKAARSAIYRGLTDSLVNSRTSASAPCRVVIDTRELHYEGLGRLIESRQFRIVQPYGTDVGTGDILTVSGRGTYCALQFVSDTTNAASATVTAMQQRLADGTLNLLTNATASILGSQDQTAQDVEVLLEPVSDDAVFRDPSLARQWTCAWDPLVHLPSGHPIGAGDQVSWTTNDIPMRGNIRVTKPNVGPAIHMTAYIFQVVAG